MSEAGRSPEELERRIERLQQQLEEWERRRRNAWHRRLAAWATRPRVAWGMGVAAVLVPLTAWAVTIPNTFVNGTIADANEVNANFTALADALNLHEPDPAAHHAKTVDASELTAGTLPDLRLSPNVSLLGPGIAESELEFDTANQAELDAHLGIFGVHAASPSAHHTRYQDDEAILAVGPHVTSVDGLAGGDIGSDVQVSGKITSRLGGFEFPDATVQVTAFQPGAAAVFPNRILVDAAGGGDFTSIQAAIDSVAPTASDPYSIDIAPGLYTEDLVLKSHLHLRGAGIDATVIGNAGAFTHVDARGVVGVKLSRLTILDDPLAAPASEQGIELDGGSEVQLEDVRVDGSYGQAAILAIGGELRVRRADLGSSFLERAVWLQAGAEGWIQDSVLESAGGTGCTVEADGLPVLTSELTLTRSRISIGSFCAGTNSSVSLSQNRLVRVVLSGAEAEIVDNVIRADDTEALVVQGAGARIIGNHIVCTGFLCNAVVLDESRSQLVGNLIEASDSPVVLLGGRELGVVVGNTLVPGGRAVTGSAGVVVGNYVDSLDPAAEIAVGGTILANETRATGTAPSQGDYLRAPRDLNIEVGNDTNLRYGFSLGTGTFTLDGPGGTLIFDPLAGATFTAGGSTLTMDSTGLVELMVAGDLSISGGANVTLAATGALSLSGATVDVTATGALSLGGDTIDANGTTSLRAEGGGSLDLSSSGEIDVTTTGTVDVNGALVTLN